MMLCGGEPVLILDFRFWIGKRNTRKQEIKYSRICWVLVKIGEVEKSNEKDWREKSKDVPFSPLIPSLEWCQPDN